METFEWTWKSYDGLEMYSKGWAPQGKPKGGLALVHGLGEHIGRYVHVGAALAERGYALLGFDLRGHGKSGGARGHIPSYESYMRDIDLFQEEIKKRYPGMPLFLYGHSMGGLLVLSYGLLRKPPIAGVIATGAALRSSVEAQKSKVLMARVLGSLLPLVAIANGLDTNMLSRDEKVVQAYVSDPLVHDRITLGAGKVLLPFQAWTREHAHEFSLPLLIMGGTADRITFPEGSQEFAAAMKGDCTLKMWNGFYHEIHNEPEKAEVLKFMIDWLDKHLPS